ncbi:MAG TPA: enoyl-CoA hydratase-related protein [Longimicrobiales bacterium]|nr:enoyl-CoA hydratase-related protein [Longimicrobiales bacterium]
MSDLRYVKVEWDAEIAVVTVDRAEKLNALNADVIRELGEVFENLRDDNAVRGVVLTGAGDRAFVAGADIGELARMDTVSGVEVSRAGQQVLGRIERFPKPVLAAVGGYALGGGCEVALACHLRIASEDARFGFPEVRLGIIPGYGGTVRLGRVVGLGRAVELILTADMIDAHRAFEIGLVSRVVAREALLSEAKALLGKVVENGPLAVRMALESVYRSLGTSTAEALECESALFGLLASTADMKEGMQAFLEKRKPEFRGL